MSDEFTLQIKYVGGRMSMAKSLGYGSLAVCKNYAKQLSNSNGGRGKIYVFYNSCMLFFTARKDFLPIDYDVLGYFEGGFWNSFDSPFSNPFTQCK